MARVVSESVELRGSSRTSRLWDAILLMTLIVAWLGIVIAIVATVAFVSSWNAAFCTTATWCDEFSVAGPMVFLLVSATVLTAALVLARQRERQRPVVIGAGIGAAVTVVALAVVAPWVDGPYVAGESVVAFGIATIPAGAWLGLYLSGP